MPENTLTHVGAEGRARMVDVSEKALSARAATASARVRLGREILARLEDGDIHLAKGAVFHTAVLAGIQAAKRTSELIPLCHGLALEGCAVSLAPCGPEHVRIEATARTTARTGVEMEALVAVSVAALTVYDMCKALSQGIEIENARLESKTGGKHDYVRSGSDDLRR